MAERHRELKEELSHASAEQPTGGYQLDRSPSPEVKTAVSAERLLALNEDLPALPEGFNVHPKLLSSSSAGARPSAPTAASTGRTPRRSRSRRC
jgi:2-oxoglutarate dehydrogenase E1 component